MRAMHNKACHNKKLLNKGALKSNLFVIIL